MLEKSDIQNEKDLVSIVVPVYNSESYLCQSMDSILAQTYNNIEIICVNDGSTDDSPRILQEYAQNDPRVVIVTQDNKGAGAARNVGLMKVKGEFVSFIDADDIVDNDYVLKMLDSITTHNSDVAICESDGFDNETNQKHWLPGALDRSIIGIEKEVFCPEDINERLFQITAGWAWDKIFRVSFLNRNAIKFQEIPVANDAYFVNVACLEARRISVVSEKLIHHRSNVSTSIEFNRDRRWREMIGMLKELKKELIIKGLYSLYERSYVNYALGYFCTYVCSFSSFDMFREFYLDFQNEECKEFGLNRYEKDYYYNETNYDMAVRMSRMCAEDFAYYLCTQQNRMIRGMDIVCRNQHAYIKDIETYIKETENYYHDLEKRLNRVIAQKKWRFPSDPSLVGKRIVLYGYGDVGKDYYHELKSRRDISLVLVVDKHYKMFSGVSDVEISQVSDIKSVEYDYIIIAVLDRTIADEIREDLIEIGAPAEKVIWYNPVEII